MNTFDAMPIKKYVQENSWIVTETNNETSIPPSNFVAGGIKTTSLKPGDGITLTRIFDLSGKIPENTVL